MAFDKNKSIDQITKIVLYVVFFWIIFLLVRSVWQNWVLRQSVNKLKSQIVTLEKEKINLNNLIIYYRSDSFKELEARKKLGMKKPGEKMVILPQKSPTSENTESANNFSQELKKDQASLGLSGEEITKPNWQLWWQYFSQ